MKTKLLVLLVMLSMSVNLARAADTVVETLQKALFEEEANHNLDAAIQAYQTVITQADDQRKFAATAIFRLGECYRKQGKTNEASAQYERVLRDFSDQTVLANLSRQNLLAWGTVKSSPAANAVGLVPATNEEAEEVQRIKALIKDSPDLINALDHNGFTPLHRAAQAGQLVVAKFLLDNKADVNARAKSGANTPLHLATTAGHKSMVELLLGNKADVNAANSNGETALFLAASNGYRSLAEVLLSHQANVNSKSTYTFGGTPNVNVTPLHVAIFKGFHAVAELLLDKGADVKAQADVAGVSDLSPNRLCGTPLHFAAQRGEVPLIELLLVHHADVNARNRYSLTPLHYAVWHDREAAAKLLLANQAGQNAPITDIPGELQNATPLHLAAYQGHQSILELLLASHADVNAKDARGYTPLCDVATPEGATAMLAAGADVNAPGYNRFSPLVRAMQQPAPDFLKALLPYKPNLEARDSENLTPLQRAVLNNDTTKAELLLNAGADPNVIYELEGKTPLFWALDKKSKRMVELLLAHHANVNILDKYGRAPLDLVSTASPPRNQPGMPMPMPAPLPPGGIPAMPQPMPIRSLRSSPGSTTENMVDELAQMLRQAGASEDLKRKPLIQIARKADSFSYTVFMKGTNEINRFSLVETIASAYGWASQRNLGNGAGWRFPDFNRISINRLTDQPNQYQEKKPNLEAILRSGDRSQDVWMQWGDIVDIPELDHPITEQWQALDRSTWIAIANMLKRTVTLVVKGQTNTLVLLPESNIPISVLDPEASFKSPNVARPAAEDASFRVRLQNVIAKEAGKTVAAESDANPGAKDTVNKLFLWGFWLKTTIYRSNLLRASSDETRVKVVRADAEGGQPKEMVFDMSGDRGNNDLWLREGDVIEIPEKP